MTSLLLPAAPDRYQQSRKVTRRDVHGVPPRWRFVLELHLAGHLPCKCKMKSIVEEGELKQIVDKPSIQEITGYAPATIYYILTREEVIALKQQVMSYYDEEFKMLYPEVIDAIRRGLNSSDKYVDAAKVYLREFGTQKGQGSSKGSVNFTAEDMVFQILVQRQGGNGNGDQQDDSDDA